MAQQDQCDICGICDESTTADQSTITETGLPTIVSISLDLNDGTHEKLRNRSLPIPAHQSCERKYIRPSSISKRKQESLNFNDNFDEQKMHVRSHSLPFDISRDCLFCGKLVEMAIKLPKHRRRQSSDAETKELFIFSYSQGARTQ